MDNPTLRIDSALLAPFTLADEGTNMRALLGELGAANIGALPPASQLISWQEACVLAEQHPYVAVARREDSSTRLLVSNSGRPYISFEPDSYVTPSHRDMSARWVRLV